MTDTITFKDIQSLVCNSGVRGLRLSAEAFDNLYEEQMQLHQYFGSTAQQRPDKLVYQTDFGKFVIRKEKQ
jgi:hypothetical protein